MNAITSGVHQGKEHPTLQGPKVGCFMAHANTAAGRLLLTAKGGFALMNVEIKRC